MLERSVEAIAKWKGFDEAIDRWLDERHDLIVFLSKFADLNGNLEQEAKVRVNSFSSLLIDYISAGHFEFYQGLLEEGKIFNDQEAIKDAGSLLETIDQSTQQALDFNEKYNSEADLSSFSADLSQLAENLATRFDAEDQMISSLHKVHQNSF